MAEELTVDPEFESLCPPLAPLEYTQLEQNLIAEGCRDPIIVWANHDNTILDGHNRYKLCSENQIAFKVKALAFESRDEAKQWMIRNQLGRRNLTAEQASHLRGMIYNSRKKASGGQDGNKNHAGRGDENRHLVKTRDAVAAELKVGASTIGKDARFARAVETIADNCGHEARKAILGREVKATRQDVEAVAKLPPEEQKMIVGKVMNGESKTLGGALNPEPKPATGIAEAVKQIRSAMRMVKGLDKNDTVFINVTAIQKHLQSAAQMLADGNPSEVCPRCLGEKCQSCNFCGRVPENLFESLNRKGREECRSN